MATVTFTYDHTNPPRLTPDEKARLDSMTPEEIERNALEDPDNPPWTEEEFARGFFARDVRRAREKTGLTQQQFAKRFQIGLARLRDWEQGRYNPDSVAKAYVKLIGKDPDAVLRALADEEPGDAAAE